MPGLRKIEIKQDRNFFMLALIIGFLIQYVAISSNGYRMPVLSNYEFEDNSHFTYQDKSEVNFWFFTDIINIPNKWFFFVISIGDLVVIFACLGLFINAYKFLRTKDD